jgi:hypothetical protein
MWNTKASLDGSFPSWLFTLRDVLQCMRVLDLLKQKQQLG